MPSQQRARKFVPISSDQLPAGAFMRETGRVGGMTSEDAGRLGGYMDDYGRVFVPAGMGARPPAPVVPSPLFRFPTKAKQNAPAQRPAPKPAANTTLDSGNQLGLLHDVFSSAIISAMLSKLM